MSSNSRKIDYRLRIAKAVERKMFCSAFQRLSVFHPLEDYRYIGFGALYFADFYLLHRQLGIKKMLSIEKSRSNATKARYNFNKPFDCIDVEFDTSNVILPQLDWNKEPVIVWLDYTCVLNEDVISDINTVLKNALPGSFLIISVNANSQNFTTESETKKTKLDKLKEEIGKAKIPREIRLNQINNRSLPTVYTKILNQEVEAVMLERNYGEKQELNFHQLFNLKYIDKIPMYTFGGLIIESGEQEELFKKARFEDLSFIRTEEEPFEIEIPKLTFREIKFLESLLPNSIDEYGQIMHMDSEIGPQIPQKEVRQFAKIYQYFPTFAETSLG